MFSFIIKKGQRGVTLLEMILVLSLIAIVILGSMRIYDSVQNNARISRTVSDLSKLVYDVKELYSSKGSFTTNEGETNLVPEIITAGLAPKYMVVGSDKLINAFGGNLEISSWGGDLTVVIKEIPKFACVKLASSDIGAYWTAVKQNGNGPDAAAPLSTDKAIDWCLDENDNSVHYQFR